MKITKNLFSPKRTIGSMFMLTMLGSFSSCTIDNEELSIDENLSSETINSQFSEPSDFIPDFDKVYTITSSSTALTLSTNGSGRIIDTPKSEITVQELWRFSPSTTAGSYYIDCLGGEDLSRLSIDGSLAPSFEDVDALGLDSSWSVTSAGSNDYFFTNLGNNPDLNRLTSFGYGFGSLVYGARLTSDTSESDLEKFEITEIEFPSSDNRVPITRQDFLSLDPYETRISSPLDNDFDPDGNELSLVSFTNNDDRVTVEMIGNQLQVRLNTFQQIAVDITYVVSDGNGGTSEEILTAHRSRRNF